MATEHGDSVSLQSVSDDDEPTFCEYPDCLDTGAAAPLRVLYDRRGRMWFLCPEHHYVLRNGFLRHPPKGADRG